MILYEIEVNKWFDKINGNTYHSVNIFSNIENKYIFSSGLCYGYGEQYKQITKEALINMDLLSKDNLYNYELLKETLHYTVNTGLKKELKKLEGF